MKSPRQSSTGPPGPLRPAVVFLDCPAPIYFLGAGFGIVCAITFLLLLGVLW